MKQNKDSFFKSKNKIYFIIRHKGIISAFFAMVTIVFGTYGFYEPKEEYFLPFFL